MFDCGKLLHPFQNDPGVSQRQRIIDNLLSDSVQIDGRSLADLLNYFSQLSAGVNYYDKNLNVADWKIFFDRSIPFLLSSISKHDTDSVREKFELYATLFDRNPSVSGLQLMLYFIYYNTFSKIHHWHNTILESDLPIERFVDDLIRTRLADLLKQFIVFSNEAAKCFDVRRIDFMKFVSTDENDAWNLNLASIYSVSSDCYSNPATQCDKIKDLFGRVTSLFPSLLESLRLITTQAEGSIKLSMIPEGKALSKNHPPHLALIFAFISLFQKLQGELNKKTKEHLQFFYTEVLKIKPAGAQVDKVFVVFELQKLLEDQYEKFRIKKGAQLNAGRDEKNADVLFETDEEIVVNEAQVAALRTLYVNNNTVLNQTFVEGVYTAPNATMADGVEKPFREDPKNWFTVGNKLSKYIEPGKRNPKTYPFARLGFVLASPVLYLAEGKRAVTVTLACKFDTPCKADVYPNLFGATHLYKKVRQLIGKKFYVITEDLLQLALDKGIPESVLDNIRNFLPDLPEKGCYEKPPLKQKSGVITEAKWRSQFFNALPEVHKAAVSEVFVARNIFKIQLSGAEDWIEPTRVKLSMQPLNMVANTFTLKVKMSLEEDKPSVTFYNKDILKEDLGTILPLVKIQLNDEIKILRGFETSKRDCCLLKDVDNNKRDVSFYHFFRDVKVIQSAYGKDTHIDVKVCGLKNFVVQNDENVMDVNSPIYPFGTRPDVTDFDIVNPIENPPPNVTGPNFYIGSKEIFCKKWKSVNVNLNWKNKPISFNDHYKGYTARLVLGNYVFGLDEDNFEYRLSFLANGIWHDEAANRKLFEINLPANPGQPTLCDHSSVYEYNIPIENVVVPIDDRDFSLDNSPFQKLDVNRRNGFIKLNLKKQDFGHKNYAFVLARQMMAYSKLPKETIATAVYYNENGDPIVIDFEQMYAQIDAAHGLSLTAEGDTDDLNAIIPNDAIFGNWDPDSIQGLEIRDIVRGENLPGFPTPYAGLLNLTSSLHDVLHDIKNKIDTDKLKKYAAIIPNEPWTPIISNMALDYTATAEIEDIDLFHLYPFIGTNKEEQIELEPTLFPTCCDEGTLFIGLSNFQPGSNLNLLFQLAEATADSESQTQPVKWSYLDNNIWKELRKGFEVLKDGTNNLTASGIVQLALPENMTLKNSVMPKNLHWIKASVAKNSRSVCETIAVHAQAISATSKMNDANDKSRLGIPLEAGKIEKLLVAESLVKSVTQLYESFGGKLSELDSSYHLRVSEHLRHKGRAIQKWDYERLVLEEFPMIYKTKCINHSFKTDAGYYENDVPYAPGYVILGVMPDLTKLKSGNSYEPRVPVSLLEEIDRFVSKRTSPFVRFKAANPRYEKVNFCVTLRLTLGVDPNFYKDKLMHDLREFMAPWAIGKYDKFSFGQCVYRSDVLQLLEGMDYIDFIKDLQMWHEKEPIPKQQPKVCPLSPRSILIAGDIDILIDDPACDDWCKESPEHDDCKPGEVLVDYCMKKNNDDEII